MIRTGSGIRKLEYLSALQGCSFFSNPFWNSSSCPPRFLPSSCSTCFKMVFVHAFDTWKFHGIALESWNRDTFKRMICFNLLQALFPLLCDFHMNLNKQNHDLTDYELGVCSFVPTIAWFASMGRNREISRWPRSFDQLLHLPAGFTRLILLRSLLLDFPCANPAMPIAPNCLFLRVRWVGCLASPHVESSWSITTMRLNAIITVSINNMIYQVCRCCT